MDLFCPEFIGFEHSIYIFYPHLITCIYCNTQAYKIFIGKNVLRIYFSCYCCELNINKGMSP